MPRKSNKQFIDFHLPKFTQISESHCGPAVIEMLLSNLNIEVSQDAVAEAGGATQLIELNGMRIDQLALAVHKLAPGVKFWFKDHATLEDIDQLVNTYQYPVGVEWQGLFEDEEDDEEDDDEDTGDSEDRVGEEDSETGEGDYGHYSLVIHSDPQQRMLIIADPYKDFISQDRIFTFEAFEARWYDYNEHTDPQTGETRLVEDYHMLFVVAPEDSLFPPEMGMKSFEFNEPGSLSPE